MDLTTEDPEAFFVPESPLKKPKLEETSRDEVSSVGEGSGSSENEDVKVKMVKSDCDSEGFEEDEEATKNTEEYWRQIWKSDGFYVDATVCPWGVFGLGHIFPLDLDSYSFHCDSAKTATIMAIDEHNRKNEGSKLEFKEIVRVNHSDAMYFVTFLAQDTSAAEPRRYQTQVFYRCYSEDGTKYSFEVYFLRPEPKMSDEAEVN